MNNEEAQILMENRFRKMVTKNNKIHNAYLLVHSEKHDIHMNIAEGNIDNLPANPHQPYLIASISKLFTAVVIGILVEKEKITYEDPISLYLDKDLLHDLHVYQGKDYTNDIKIKHLLNHTSGLHDFMEDKPKKGRSMLQLILEKPNDFWTPQEVIHWSKKHLKSHFPPGEGFHYSDTGYHLLGLIVEDITNMPFHQVLSYYIFDPLEMNHSYLQNTGPKVTSEYPLASTYLHHTNVSNFTSLSVNYAGGGIISTNEDLLKFMKAFSNFEIIKEDTFEQMKDWAKFSLGINYGYGLMNFTTVPLFMPKKYNAWGNAGSTGSFMFYHPEMDTYLIGSLNQFRFHRKGVRLMFKMIDAVTKIG